MQPIQMNYQYTKITSASVQQVGMYNTINYRNYYLALTMPCFTMDLNQMLG